jgi:hypothetical protein
MRLRTLTLASAFLAAAPAAAQQRTAALETAPPATLFSGDTVQDSAGVRRRPQAERIAARSAMGSLGFLAGALAGGYAGGTSLNEGGEDGGLLGAVLGATIGGVVGGGLGAAMPRYRGGKCNHGERFGRGLLGSFVGMLVASGAAGDPDNEGNLALFPLFAGVGAGLAADC